MKRIFVVAAIISVVWGHTPAWAQLLPRFNPGDVLHAVDLNDIVDHILGSGRHKPSTSTVVPAVPLGRRCNRPLVGILSRSSGRVMKR